MAARRKIEMMRTAINLPTPSAPADATAFDDLKPVLPDAVASALYVRWVGKFYGRGRKAQGPARLACGDVRGTLKRARFSEFDGRSVLKRELFRAGVARRRVARRLALLDPPDIVSGGRRAAAAGASVSNEAARRT